MKDSNVDHKQGKLLLQAIHVKCSWSPWITIFLIMEIHYDQLIVHDFIALHTIDVVFIENIIKK